MLLNARILGLCGLCCLLVLPARADNNLMDLGKDLLQTQLPRKGQAASPEPADQQSSSGGTASQGVGLLGAGLGAGEIGAGLKDALKVAADRVTSRLGRSDGFNGDPAVHIPLPNSLRTAQQALKLAGQSALLDDLELKLNRAAEAATPQARQIFWDALSRMTLEDAKGILNGPRDSATQYFRKTMTPDLKTAMRPLVDRTVAESGAVKTLQGVGAMASTVPLLGQAAQTAPGLLTDHVLDHALSGIFTYLGQEEAAIRSDPAKRTTDLLKKLFGG